MMMRALISLFLVASAMLFPFSAFGDDTLPPDESTPTAETASTTPPTVDESLPPATEETASSTASTTEASAPVTPEEPVSCAPDDDYNLYCTYADGHSALVTENLFFERYRTLEHDTKFLLPTLSWNGAVLSNTQTNRISLSTDTLGAFGWAYDKAPSDNYAPYQSVPLSLDDIVAGADITLTLFRGKPGRADIVLSTTLSHDVNGALNNIRLFDQPGHYFVVIAATYRAGMPVPGFEADASPFFSITRFNQFLGSGIDSRGNPPGTGLYQPAAYGMVEFDVVDADTTPEPTPEQEASTTPTGISNVMFLPGIKGSRLYRPDGDTEKKLWDPGLGNKILDMALDEQGESISSEIYARESDIIDVASGLKVYDAFITEMNGLKTDHTINDWRPVAYDWRLSLPDLLANGTKRGDKIYYEEATSTPYIEQTLRELASTSKSGKVTIIAHSNGGLVAKALMQKLGDVETARLVDKVILVGVPQSGAPQSIGSLLYGYGEGLPDWGKFVVSEKDARTFAGNSPMGYHLLPSQKYFDMTLDANHRVANFTATYSYPHERIAYGPSIDSARELYDYLGAKDGGRTKPASSNLNAPEILNSQLLSYAESTHASLDAWQPPASTTVYQIAGWGDNTISGIDFYEEGIESNPIFIHFPKYRPTFVEDGDGVVPIPSALMMAPAPNVKRYWVDFDSIRKDTKLRYDHGTMFGAVPLRNFLVDVISGDSGNLPNYILSQQPNALDKSKRLLFFLHSPLTLELTSTDGKVNTEIEDVKYGEFGDVKYVIAPAGGPYTLVMHGQDTGTFSLDIQEMSGNDIIATSTIANVPTTADTLATLQITNGIADASALAVDEDGDGTTDISLAPQASSTVFYTAPASVETITQTLTTSSGGSSGSVLLQPVLGPVKSPAFGFTNTSVENRVSPNFTVKNDQTSASSGQVLGAEYQEPPTSTPPDSLGAKLMNWLSNVFYTIWKALINGLKLFYL